MMITHAQALRRATERLDAPRPDDEKWSTDFFPHDREMLLNYLAQQGRSGDFGSHFEDLANPHTVHIPGCAERSASALLDAVADTGLSVAVETKPGKPPRFGLGGKHATAGLMDLRGVVLALVVDYAENGRQAPAELVCAASRISMSGTHAGGVAYRFGRALKRAVRA
ncbi:hypothetical protein MOV08_27855 [Streptomyces yunnanensis]|uniref:Uncharacterized protein n=1 Tax=Streptomyces yunnanensis TaxID=156453 RepID=A0ABY8ACR0_9ACTN|nr:hypothetical protein [Streptomyces yunnanensis]WEB42688.1 hypothetical protein MOV08_27855 [Streptomyces yunnanensis]